MTTQTNLKLKSPIQPTAAFEEITPEIAHKLLENNAENRPIDEKRIIRYCNEIKLGRWQVNGDTIRIATNGQLLDGQHRLHALIRADEPIETLVVRNLDPQVFSTIDAGKSRTCADVLSISGYVNVNALAGAARLILLIEKSQEGKLNIGQRRFIICSSNDILDVVRRHSGLVESIRETSRYPKMLKFIGPSMFAGLHYAFTGKNPELAKTYFDMLEKGIGMDQNSVVYQVREKLISFLGMSSVNKVDIGHKAVIVITGWNLIRDGLWDSRLVIQNDWIVDQIK